MGGFWVVFSLLYDTLQSVPPSILASLINSQVSPEINQLPDQRCGYCYQLYPLNQTNEQYVMLEKKKAQCTAVSILQSLFDCFQFRRWYWLVLWFELHLN